MEELNEISLRERIRLNLVSCMESANINQVQLAEKLGISKGTVNNWARGNNSPDVDMVPKICKVLGISILDLYSPTKFEVNEYKTSKKAPSLSDEAMKLAEDYEHHMDDRGRETVRAVADLEVARKKKQSAILREQRTQMEVADEILPPTTLHQPYSQVAAAEGNGVFLMDDDYEEISVEMNEYTKQADVILKVVGRSMVPVIADGDRILVRKQPSVRIGEIGVFVVDGQGYLKEYQADRLVSLNPDIDDVLIGDLQSAECYGKFIKVLDPDWVK